MPTSHAESTTITEDNATTSAIHLFWPPTNEDMARPETLILRLNHVDGPCILARDESVGDACSDDEIYAHIARIIGQGAMMNGMKICRVKHRKVSRVHAIVEVSGDFLRVTNVGLDRSKTFIEQGEILLGKTSNCTNLGLLRLNDAIARFYKEMPDNPWPRTCLAVEEFPLLSPVCWGPLDRLVRGLRQVKRPDLPRERPPHTLLLGPSGVGKTKFAELCARLGSRVLRERVNTSCLSANTISSLIGSSKVFNPGAKKRSSEFDPGALQRANGAAIFLDEIGDSEVSVQNALLLFLDDGLLAALGPCAGQNIDVQVIAATDQGLGGIKDAFRNRIQLVVEIPELHDRAEELPYLFEKLLHLEHEDAPATTLSPSAAWLLCSWKKWPANTRTLRDVAAECAHTTAKGELISSKTLAAHLGQPKQSSALPRSLPPAAASVEVDGVTEAALEMLALKAGDETDQPIRTFVEKTFPQKAARQQLYLRRAISAALYVRPDCGALVRREARHHLSHSGGNDNNKGPARYVLVNKVQSDSLRWFEDVVGSL